jgi:uncharacterized protein YndB with AHSA1/START domain
METMAADEPIRRTLTVPVAPREAFEAFTERFATWYPPEYTWSGEVLETIGIEPGEDGLCFERGPGGFRCDWGRVLAWEPPGRLVLAWQVSPRREPQPNPDHASEIEIRFESADQNPSATRVEFEHRHFDRHGPGADDYRDAMNSEPGWDYILGRFEAGLSRT